MKLTLEDILTLELHIVYLRIAELTAELNARTNFVTNSAQHVEAGVTRAKIKALKERRAEVEKALKP